MPTVCDRTKYCRHDCPGGGLGGECTRTVCWRPADVQNMHLQGRGLHLSAQPVWTDTASRRRRAVLRVTTCGAPRSASRSVLVDDAGTKHLENSAPADRANGASHVDLVPNGPPPPSSPISIPCTCSRPDTAQASTARAAGRCSRARRPARPCAGRTVRSGAAAAVCRHRRPGRRQPAQGAASLPRRPRRAAPLRRVHRLRPRRPGPRCSGPGTCAEQADKPMPRAAVWSSSSCSCRGAPCAAAPREEDDLTAAALQLRSRSMISKRITTACDAELELARLHKEARVAVCSVR